MYLGAEVLMWQVRNRFFLVLWVVGYEAGIRSSVS